MITVVIVIVVCVGESRAPAALSGTLLHFRLYSDVMTKRRAIVARHSLAPNSRTPVL